MLLFKRDKWVFAVVPFPLDKRTGLMAAHKRKHAQMLLKADQGSPKVGGLHNLYKRVA